MIATQLQANIDTRNAQMLAMVQQYTYTEEQQYDEAPPDKPAANALTHDEIQLEMLRVLQKIQQDMNSNSTDCGNRNNNNANQGGCGNTRRSENKKTPNDATSRRLINNKYCWTHGGCNHDSAN